MITCTLPEYPVVPLSINGVLEAKHILFTCLLASRLSSAPRTISNCENHLISYWGAFILSWCATISTSGLNLLAVSFATSDFDLLICLAWNKNCLLRLDKSIVSRSIIWTFLKPVKTTFFTISIQYVVCHGRRTHKVRSRYHQHQRSVSLRWIFY